MLDIPYQLLVPTKMTGSDRAMNLSKRAMLTAERNTCDK